MMLTMSNDMFSKVIPFLGAADIHSLRLVSRGLKEKKQLDLNPMQYLFGENIREIAVSTQLCNKLIKCFIKKPCRFEEIRYEASKNWMDRIKWVCGFRNSLDQEIYDRYYECREFIVKYKPKNSMCLRNSLKVVRHIGDEIEAYRRFKNRYKSALVWKCILRISSFFSTYVSAIPKARSITTDFLYEDGSVKKKHIKIGEFNLRGAVKEYKVYSFQSIGRFGGNHTFNEFPPDNTYIGIFPSHVEPNMHYMGNAKNTFHNVSIKKEKTGLGAFKIRFEVEFRDGVNNWEGSDRVLDRKLMQIMVEIFQQNVADEMIGVSNYDDLVVLTAGGMNNMNNHDSCDYLIDSIQAHRSDPDNKLFPPFKDYGQKYMRMTRNDLDKRIVYFTRSKVPQSWSEILSESPILYQNQGLI